MHQQMFTKNGVSSASWNSVNCLGNREERSLKGQGHSMINLL